MRFIWALLYLICCHSINGQYYLRGEVKDHRGRKLEGVKIQLRSKGSFPYYSGSDGTFGIPLSAALDSAKFSIDGYEPLTQQVDARTFQSVVLAMLPSTARQYASKLSSATTNLKKQNIASFSSMGESYTNLVENDFIPAASYPETGFALNIDKASYSNIRRFINNEMRVPQDAVRIDEMLNYFDFSAQEDRSLTNRFNCRTQLSICPWNKTNRLLFLNITAPRVDLASIPSSHLVFLVDISGSMDKPNRLPLLQSAFKLLIKNLREKDTISLVTYGGGVGIILNAVAGNEKKKITAAIDSLSASGDTPGEGAIKLAYSLAKERFIPNGNNRVILATDGDFNVGLSSEKELENLITGYRQSGIYLTCLGVGMGNYKDSKLETLAKKGNGNFAYIDNIQEAEKVLVTEFTNTVYAVAHNASVRINFNPQYVNDYRLIGFDNKMNAINDSTSTLEGGEVGSGHSMMAVFEIKPNKYDSLFSGKDFATVNLQYRIVNTDRTTQQAFSIPYQPFPIEQADSCYRFAASVAGFGLVLKQSKYIDKYTFEDAQSLAATAINPNDFHQREFLYLVEKAGRVYNPVKKKKGVKNR